MIFISFFQWSDIDQNAGNVISSKIVSINRDNMTAVVDIIPGNIPIHYHCDENSIDDDGTSFEVSYPDSMDEGGSGAFSVGDEVLVLFRRINNEEPVIIGHKNNPRGCCGFRFYLEGEGYGELTENVSFIIYNENQVSQPITDLEYDEDQGCWVFSLNTESEGFDCEGPFWAKYIAAGFKVTQYQGVTENFFEEGSRVIFGDGTLYSDLLEKLVGEIGYWEDWEDDLLCGKHGWIIYMYADNSVYINNELCPTIPKIYTGEFGSVVSLIISSTVLSMNQNSVGEKPEGLGATAFGLKYDSSESITASFRSLTLNFSQLDFGEEAGAYNNLVLKVGSTTENKYLVLYIHSHDCDEFIRETSSESHICIEDELSENIPFIVDSTDERFSKIFEKHIDYVYFFGSISYIGYSNLSIDYIDFKKWEPWDLYGLPTNPCLNHQWSINLSRRGSYITLNDPIDVSDPRFGDHGVWFRMGEYVNGLNVTNNSIDDNWSSLSMIWLLNQEKITYLTSTKIVANYMKIKFTAGCQGSLTNFSYCSISLSAEDGTEIDFAMAYASKSYIDEMGYVDISEHSGGDELLINLSEYGLSNGIIAVILTGRSQGENTTIGLLTSYFNVEYIDFI